MALKDKFGIVGYTGVELNELLANTAKKLKSNAKILNGDILSIAEKEFTNKKFDYVFSLD